jgi:hypothetical protein
MEDTMELDDETDPEMTDADLEEAGDMTTPINLPAPSKAQKSC